MSKLIYYKMIFSGFDVPFVDDVQLDNIKDTKQLLNVLFTLHMDPNIINASGQNLLIWTILFHQDSKVVKFLIDNGVDLFYTLDGNHVSLFVQNFLSSMEQYKHQIEIYNIFLENKLPCEEDVVNSFEILLCQCNIDNVGLIIDAFLTMLVQMNFNFNFTNINNRNILMLLASNKEKWFKIDNIVNIFYVLMERTNLHSVDFYGKNLLFLLFEGYCHNLEFIILSIFNRFKQKGFDINMLNEDGRDLILHMLHTQTINRTIFEKVWSAVDLSLHNQEYIFMLGKAINNLYNVTDAKFIKQIVEQKIKIYFNKSCSLK